MLLRPFGFSEGEAEKEVSFSNSNFTEQQDYVAKTQQIPKAKELMVASTSIQKKQAIDEVQIKKTISVIKAQKQENLLLFSG